MESRYIYLSDFVPYIVAYLVGAIGIHFVGRWFANSNGHIGEWPIWAVAWTWPLTAFVLIPVVFIWASMGLIISKIDNWIAFYLLKHLVHEDEYGQLWRARGPREPFQWVRVQDSTGVYWIPVPPDVRTAREAVGWTYELGHSGYDPIARA